MSDWNEQIIWNQQERIKELEKEVQELKLKNTKLNNIVNYFINEKGEQDNE